MRELEPFEARLATAVKAFADRADTRVDAAQVAARTVRPRRFASFVWLGHPLPARASILVLLGLLIALLAWSVGAGAPWSHQASVVPPPSPTLAAAPAPSATPLRQTDGIGPEYVVGTETIDLTTPYATAQAGDVLQYRGGVVTNRTTMNDPRVTGTGTYHFSVDGYGHVGPEWGTYRLENADGAWEGTCRSGSWDDGNALSGTCWLVGSGAYVGYTYYRSYRWVPGDVTVEGIIFAGSPPAP